MTITILDNFWHRTLKRPYRLARTIDEGTGQPVVLLHGIGRTGVVWKHVVRLLLPLGYRAVAFDLLGFGASPKPDWIAYGVDDHARAVIKSIVKLRAGPVVLVGHSMGCLVAVRVARLRPDLVQHLVLYEMPLYDGLPEKRRYKVRINWYLKLYERVTRYQPTFNTETARLIERLTNKVTGLEVSEQTWPAFIKSLENTIMKQTTASDIKQLDVPMDVIYGSLDMFVIRGEAKKFFGSDADNIKTHTVRAGHIISVKSSQFIVERISASFQDK